MSCRAGIVVTGTEVLTGRVADRNGPWLAEQLLQEGIELTATLIVGDRPEDMAGALRYMAGEGCDLIITSGGLGPTADDLTAQVAADFQGREMALDEDLEARIAEILKPLLKRWPGLDPEAIKAANRKQAMVPHGATIIEPAGTAPGLVIPAPEGTSGPSVLVLPGPPRELQPMWADAVATDAFKAATTEAVDYRQSMLRLFALPESEITETLNLAPEKGIALDGLEITTCQRNAELEIVTRYEPPQQAAYEALTELIRERHSVVLYSEDGTTIDDQVADLLLEQDKTIAVAESCTGGLLGGRIVARPGSSKYMLGGLIAYANEAKINIAGVDPQVIEEHGSVAWQTAEALAEGARAKLGADVGVGITGVAGPGGGAPGKPIGLVWFCASDGETRLTGSVQLPGSRTDVRERSVMVAMHLIRRLLRGEGMDGLPTTPPG